VLGVDPVALCADVSAAWHASWLTALGLRSERRGRAWRALDAPPPIYWAAITLRADASARDVQGSNGTVCDSWCAVDLSPRGFVERGREPWFVRPAGELDAEDAPARFRIQRVSSAAEVAEFERVSMRGFGGQGTLVAAGTIHPPSILADPRMTMLVGRLEGEAVAAAMSYRTDAAVGIYGVTTIASARRRGCASALTRALVDPGRPALLSPSPEGESLYRRLGFVRVGELRMWRRP
jgi:hypothetical protein